MKQFIISSETDAIREVENRVNNILGCILSDASNVESTTLYFKLFINDVNLNSPARVTKWKLHASSRKK